MGGGGRSRAADLIAQRVSRRTSLGSSIRADELGERESRGRAEGMAARRGWFPRRGCGSNDRSGGRTSCVRAAMLAPVGPRGGDGTGGRPACCRTEAKDAPLQPL